QLFPQTLPVSDTNDVAYNANLIFNFGEIQRAALLEDQAALRGRRYILDAGQMMGVGADSVCMNFLNGTPQATTWYAGELYHTLPVRPGDEIYVFSRTILWQEGLTAIASGDPRNLHFFIGDVLPPSFTGDVPTVQSDPLNPNRRFVKEDVTYPNNPTGAGLLFRI